MGGRPRTYDFGSLAIGDCMAVPLNGRAPKAAQESLIGAAAHYQRTRDAAFLFTTDTVSQPGFVLLQRIDGRGRVTRLIVKDQARMARLDIISRQRSLTAAEQERVYRTNLRLVRRAA